MKWLLNFINLQGNANLNGNTIPVRTHQMVKIKNVDNIKHRENVKNIKRVSLYSWAKNWYSHL